MMRITILFAAAYGLMLFTNTVVKVDEVNAYNHTCTYWDGLQTYEVDPWTTAPCQIVATKGGSYQ